MATNYAKPRLTRDGLTAVGNCYIAGKRVRPEEKIEQILSQVQTLEMTFFGSIHPYRPAEFWEYMYLGEGTRPCTLEGWLKFVADRERKQGVWELRGNFVELSHSWDIETRDPALLERFREAFRAQPGSYHKARADWEKSCEDSWAPRKRRWANVNPEEYFREREAKAS